MPLAARRMRLTTVLLASLSLLTGGLAVGALPASAASSDLFFSEYVEGSSFNKAIEIYNGTGAPVNLAGYSIELYSNGSATPGATRALTGTLAADDVFVGGHSSAAPAIVGQADDTVNGGVYNWNGDDAIVLKHAGAVIDVIGQVGVDPGTEWGTGVTSTADNTLRRKSSVTAGDTDGGNAFDPAVEWDGFAVDTFGGVGGYPGDAAPVVASTSPSANATSVGHAATLSATFTEPVDLDAGALSLVCGGTPLSLTVSAGPTTYTLTPSPELGFAQSCTLGIPSIAVSDRDLQDPVHPKTDTVVSFSTEDAPFDCTSPVTSIPTIQGDGETSPRAGQPVVTEGVVVGDYEGASPALRGFYLQDATGDGNAATSDAIFVFNGDNDAVALGDVVKVAGPVSEFQGQTQVTASKPPVVCGTGDVAPIDVTLPAADGLERYEGMLTRFPQTMTVNETFQLGRFGQVTVSSAGRLMTPTAVVDPGQPAVDLQAENNATRLIIDDASQGQNPDPIVFGRGGQPLSATNTLRMGDTAQDMVGVLTYTWAGNSASGNAFRLRPMQALHGAVAFTAANPRPDEPEDVGGSLKVASVNVLNYFNTFTGCTLGVGGQPTDCRGAANAFELERQQTKTVNVIKSLDADVVGLMEIENDGYGPDSAIKQLTDAVNQATGDSYRYVDVDAGTGQVNADGTDAIKVGLLYRSSRVKPVGQTAALNTGAFGLYQNDDNGNGTPDAPIGRNRPAIAQAFEDLASGESVVVSVNHLKSKGSSCAGNISPVPTDPDTGDGQGNCNLTRTQAARELAAWLAADPTLTGDTDALVIGDLNSYAHEDPVTALTDAGFEDMIAARVAAPRYSYVFDGQSGYLDHALASSSLTRQVTGVTEFHVNADEPAILDYNTDFKSPGQVASFYAPDHFRASDHDPVLVGLDLGRCTFSDDNASKTRTLERDCTTSSTLLVPSGWTFDGDGHTVTAYDAAGGHFTGAVIANAGTVAHVRDVIVTGRGLADICDGGSDALRGILLDGASGSVTASRVENVRQAGSGCQEGNGIEVRSTSTATSATVTGNTVTGYQKTGVLVNGLVQATLSGNTVRGLGPVGYIAQNGIQVSRGAAATVDGNSIEANWYTGADTACGLLVFQADGVKQKRNTFVGNEQDFCNVGRGGGAV